MTKQLQQITVIHFPCQPHFFSFGGFDIQMNRIIEMTNSEHIAAKKVDLWSRHESFEVAHFWGASDSHKRNIQFCKANGIKVVISGLFPHYTIKNRFKNNIWNIIHRITHCESVIFDADIITVINKEQAEVVSKYYGYPKSQIRIIPTILDDHVFEKITSVNQNDDFILCVGTICSRKNQARLAQASVKMGVKCIFVGRFDSREPIYKDQFLSIQNSNNSLIEHLEDITIEELCDLYVRCNVVSCISLDETEPASILEAMHFKKPVVASNLPFAKNSKFDGIILCKQDDIKSIIKALRLSFEKKGRNEYPSFNSKTQHSESVKKLYVDMYFDVLNSD